MLTTNNKLTNLQLELLKVFQYNLDESQLNEVKELLSEYFLKNIDKEMDKVWKEKNWSDEEMDNILSDHPRTPYKK
jgi:hypothetical protein